MMSIEKEWRPGDYLPLPPSVTWIQPIVSSTASALPLGNPQPQQPADGTRERVRVTLLARLLRRGLTSQRSRSHGTTSVS